MSKQPNASVQIKNAEGEIRKRAEALPEEMDTAAPDSKARLTTVDVAQLLEEFGAAQVQLDGDQLRLRVEDDDGWMAMSFLVASPDEVREILAKRGGVA